MTDGASAGATVTIIIVPVNDAPAAADDAYEISHGQLLAISTPGVLRSDEDGDGDQSSVISVGATALGTVTIGPEDDLSYVASPGASGLDRFDYQVSDGDDCTARATITVHIVVVNRLPRVNDDVYLVPPGDELVVPARAGLLANDDDPDGDPLTVRVDSRPTRGMLTVAPDDAFIYRPDPGFVGVDEFRYELADGGGVAFAAVRIIVISPPPPNLHESPNQKSRP